MGQNILNNTHTQQHTTMDKEPTLEEIRQLVSFYRDENGKLKIYNIFCDVAGIYGNVGVVFGKVYGGIANCRVNVHSSSDLITRPKPD